MATSDNVLTKLHDLLLYIIPQLAKFPRDQKFLLADRIETRLLDVQERCIRAYYSRDKKEHLREANVLLELVRHLVRLSHDMKTKPSTSLLLSMALMALLGAAPKAGATSGNSSPFLLDTRNFENSLTALVDTRAPDIIANTGITDPGGSSLPITMAMLNVSDGTNDPATIVYSLQNAPVHGTLLLDGVPLLAGAMLTQADIDAGLLVYQRNAGEALSDLLEFSLVDIGGHAPLSGAIFFGIAGFTGDTGALVLLDTRNYTASSEHAVHTDARAYLEADTVPGSLRQAIANAATNDTVDFDAALDGGTITLGGAELTIDKDLTIDGSALAGGITVSGNSASRVFNVNVAGGLAELKGLTIRDGNAVNGGGVQISAGSLVVTDSTIADNQAAGGFISLGGGIHVTSAGQGVVVSNSTISGNSADKGGGIYSFSPAANEVINSTLANNVSANNGGAIINNGATFIITSSTIVSNSAQFGGGIQMDGVAPSMTFENSIVAGNTAPTGPDINKTSGTLTPAGSNLIGINSTVTNEFPAGPLVGTSGSPVLARLAPLGDYGVPTETAPPLPGSAAIEGAVLLGSTPTTDQRGAPRPNGSLPDIGAVEAFPFSSLPLVDTDNDGIDDRLEPAYPQFTVGVDDSALDTDGDGSTDAEELANMTDPDDGDDFFRVLALSPAPGFDPVTNPLFSVSLATFPGLPYALESGATPGTIVPVPASAFTADVFTVTSEILIPPGNAGFVRGKRN